MATDRSIVEMVEIGMAKLVLEEERYSGIERRRHHQSSPIIVITLFLLYPPVSSCIYVFDIAMPPLPRHCFAKDIDTSTMNQVWEEIDRSHSVARDF
eukprot:gene13412-543_t